MPTRSPTYETITVKQPIVINKFKAEIENLKQQFDEDNTMYAADSQLYAFFGTRNDWYFDSGGNIRDDAATKATILDHYIYSRLCDSSDFAGTCNVGNDDFGGFQLHVMSGDQQTDTYGDAYQNALVGSTDNTDYTLQVTFTAPLISDTTTPLQFAQAIAFAEDSTAAPAATREITSSSPAVVEDDDDDDMATEIAIIVGVSLGVVAIAFLAWQYDRRNRLQSYQTITFTPRERDLFRL
jgi:hypothetical protein